VVINKDRKNLLVLKTLISFVIVISAFAVFSQVNISYAQPIDCDFTNQIAPRPLQIICPVMKLARLVIVVAGAVFTLMLGFGAIKLSTSLGDPKAYESSMNTVLFAGVGAFIVLGAFTIFFILNRTLGLGLSWTTPADIFSSFTNEFRDLLLGMGIRNP